MQIPNWDPVANGVWRAMIGSTSALDLLSYSGVAPRLESLAALPEQPFPLLSGDITVAPARDKLVLTLPLDRAEKLYGLGLNFTSIEVQQTVRHLHVDHFGGKDNGRTHAPVPFYVSGKGYGVFVNLARTISIYAGGSHRKENHPPVVDRLSADWVAVQPSSCVEIVVPAPGAEVLVFAGPTPLDVVRRFNLFCGGGCLPPRWGLGFWHRVPIDNADQDVEAEADAFAERGFPLDVIGLEPGWHTQSYPTTYEWHAERFPKPQEFIVRMSERRIRVNLWENCYVSPECDLGERLAPLCGSHTGGWGGIIPDLALPEARQVLAEQHAAEHLDAGVSGYKLDECDGYDRWIWPDHAVFPSGLTGEELRQVYGVLFQRTTTEMYRARNLRTYGLVRASNAGSVSFPYVIYNDFYDHRGFITALCSSSFCGLLWTPEARASETPEEWLRRMQAVCLSPLAMINAWADGTKPWSFPDVTDAVRDVMLLRMRLLPYIYTAFAQYQTDGTPPVRAMVLDEDFVTRDLAQEQGPLDGTENPYSAAAGTDVKDQFMLGPSLLVAPVFAGETERVIVLPKGHWYDFYTGALVGCGPAETTVPAPLERIPLLVRDGGIIPLMPPMLHVPRAGERVGLEVRHYGAAEGVFDLYDDDGETYDYERGACSWLRLRVDRSAEGELVGTSELISGLDAATHDAMVWRFMS
jgi:alpha-glucosidase (family GH31 glycosyl hydrolase)